MSTSSRHSKRGTFLLAALVILSMSLDWAPADFWIEQTGYEETGSFTVSFILNPAPSEDFDLIGARITTGGPFESPAFDGFGVDGWSNSNTDTLAAASGPGTQLLTFSLNVFGKLGDPFEFDFVLFEVGADTPSLEAHGIWGQDEFGFYHTTFTTSSDWNPDRGPFGSLPAPGAALLGMLGLGVIAIFNRRLG